MQANYYVVHEGTDTIFALEECKIVVVKSGNEEAEEAADNGYTNTLLENADAVYSENEITLG